MYLRAEDYLEDFEKVYGASRILPALDGADHFRFRKAMSPAYWRGRLAGQLDQLYGHARAHMANWAVGDSFPAVSMCPQLINAELSPLSLRRPARNLRFPSPPAPRGEMPQAEGGSGRALTR